MKKHVQIALIAMNYEDRDKLRRLESEYAAKIIIYGFDYAETLDYAIYEFKAALIALRIALTTRLLTVWL